MIWPSNGSRRHPTGPLFGAFFIPCKKPKSYTHPFPFSAVLWNGLPSASPRTSIIVKTFEKTLPPLLTLSVLQPLATLSTGNCCHSKMSSEHHEARAIPNRAKMSQQRLHRLTLIDYINKYAIFILVVLFFIVNFYYNRHIQSSEFPYLGYPLSEHNVEAFHKAVSRELADHSDASSSSVLPAASHIESFNTPPLRVKNIYGPLEFQPAELFQPYNTNSLIFVSGMLVLYIGCLLL